MAEEQAEGEHEAAAAAEEEEYVADAGAMAEYGDGLALVRPEPSSPTSTLNTGPRNAGRRASLLSHL
jgi:hypothetical protein